MSAAVSAARTTTGTPRLEVRTGLDPAVIQPAWTRLCDELGTTFACYPQWLRAWRRCFDDRPLHLVTAHRAGQLVGVLPLVRRHGTLVGATDRFPIPATAPVATDTEVLGALFGAAAASRPRALHWNALALPSGAERTVRAAVATTLPRVRLEVQDHDPVIDLTRSWADQQAHIGRGQWRDLRRRRRRAEELGDLRFETWTAAPPAELFDACLRLEACGWKGEQGTAIACQPAQVVFYRWLTDWFADRGWLRFDVLRLDGQLLAFELNAACGGTLHGLKVGHDESLRHLAPGLLLQAEVLQRAFDDPDLHLADLGTGVTPLKQRWATSLEPRYRLRAHPRGLRGGARAAGSVASTRTRARLVAGLEGDTGDHLRRARARVRNLRGHARGQVRP